MTTRIRLLGSLLTIVAAAGGPACAPAPEADAAPSAAPSAGATAPRDATADFDALAVERTSATSRLPLAAPAPATAAALESLELFRGVDAPNVLRALELIPGSAAPYATAFQTLLYGGTVEPETKAAMGLQIGHVLQSPYAVVHLRRILRATDEGRQLLEHVEGGGPAGAAQDAALRYAAWLTEDVHGVDDERFRQVRGYYTDAQLVELTMTVSFFNYFTRFVEAANLPVEKWALDSVAQVPRAGEYDPYPARVSLISDEQIAWAAETAASRRRGRDGDGGGLGLGLVNSQRAMNLVPDVTSAWRAYTGSTGAGAEVDREIKLQISFAVSTANGCRYCTLHQVQGLRRLGVSPAKLLQMQKDDSALTPRELVAVTFARKLTATPPVITDADYDALRAEFGERGALEAVLQTCNFAFMNRFTDNLGLPSEDEAIRVYREVYGGDWHQ